MAEQERAEHKTEILIIGAGISGLAAAQVLQEAGRQVMIVDKGRSVGGRLATRRINGGLADHGAQYFTVRSDAFQDQVDQWIDDGLVYQWTAGFSTGSLTSNEKEGHARYAVNGGMNRLAKQLAEDLEAGQTESAPLDIHVNVRIESVSREDSAWIAVDSEGNRYRAQAVLLTAPVPQSLAMLDAGPTQLTVEDREQLNQIRYSPCIAGLFHYEGGVKIPKPGAIQRPANTIPWVADNQMKGISPDVQIITLHADPSYSRRYWDSPEVEIIETMQHYMDSYLTPESKLVEAQVKRWRYSFPETIHPERSMAASRLPGLVFAGDAFGGPRVEGAFLSGRAAGDKLLDALD